MSTTAQPAGPRSGARATRRPDRMVWLKLALWIAGLAPAAKLAWRAYNDDLTANPIELITLKTGFWALTFIMATLAITPLRRITGWNRIIQLRRPLGLFAFFYATLHFLTYVTLDQFFDFGAIIEDIAKRPYITVGFTAFVLMIPLAVTSTKGWIRRLGRRWLQVHRLIYVTAALGVLHFYWKKSSKNDIFEPLVFAAILAVLLGARLAWSFLRRRSAATR
ncbi:MAG TPA: protein-methionine-sulfoxide reductase heme-binding subunit MsrQ [Longimicrobiales bacterium]|nr:protein-methionine-sulfoxide reductase heme-binding subunit MsrQ [Longimicrobiales bacterium]